MGDADLAPVKVNPAESILALELTITLGLSLVTVVQPVKYDPMNSPLKSSAEPGTVAVSRARVVAKSTILTGFIVFILVIRLPTVI